MRQVDVADELAFLEMECALFEKPMVGQQIAERSFKAIDDQAPRDLFRFYKSYRACVRAKVAALRAEQIDSDEIALASEEAQRYLSLAEQHAACLAGTVMLLVRGLMGTGKSTIANALSEILGAELLQTDLLRRHLFDASDVKAKYGEGVYTDECRRKVYDEMFAQANDTLSKGIPVVLDGTFLIEELRRRAASIAKKYESGYLIVNCCRPDDVVRQRIRKRLTAGDAASEARPELLEQQRADEQPVASGQPQCEIDTRATLKQQQDLVLQRLRGIHSPSADY